MAPTGGWYSHFRAGERVFVIFANRVFAYAEADAAAREEIEAYGRSVGVPEEQLDW